MKRDSQLPAIRQQQLAALRRAAGVPERFAHTFACKHEDREFQATFARLPPAKRFTCESVERIDRKTSVLDQMRGWFRPTPSLKVSAEEIDFDSMPCAYCKARSVWTLCSRCHALVCGLNTVGEQFVCRPSCGASFDTSPLVEVDGAKGSPSGVKAIGQSPVALLPRR